MCVQEASSCAPLDDTKKQVRTLLPQLHVATSIKVSYLFIITMKFRAIFRAELFPQYLISQCYPLFLLFQGAACCRSSCLCYASYSIGIFLCKGNGTTPRASRLQAARRQTYGIQARINTVRITAKKPRLEAANLAKKEKV